MSRVVLALVAALALVACSRGDAGGGDSRPLEDLALLASSGDEVAYKATYRYTMAGLAGGEATLSVSQRPPDSVRKLEASSNPKDGRPVTFSQWTVRVGGKTYACDEMGTVSCIASEGPPGAFGFARVDRWFELARRADGFATVEEAEQRTVAGETARCYRATSSAATPRPAVSPEPRYDPDRYSYELCFSRDGIPLAIRERALGPVPSGHTRADYLLRAVSVSRAVADSDLELPGPLRTPPGPDAPRGTPRS